MTRAVKNSPIASADISAIVIESSIVMRRSTMFSNASLKMVSADQRSGQANNANPVERFPEMKPDSRCRESDKYDAQDLDEFKTVLMIVVFMTVV